MIDDPALYRRRAIELARALEQLRQARSLARTAAAELAELSVDHGLGLTTEIACATAAANDLMQAEHAISSHITRIPLV
jgi:hypothetical protein